MKLSIPLALGLYVSSFSTAQILHPPVPVDLESDQSQDTTLSSATDSCEEACDRLVKVIPSQVYLSGDGDSGLWDAKQSDLIPKCRVEPANTADVSEILKIIVATNCKFAVKSGGHSRMAGASNALNGITIDLARMSGIRVSQDRKSVYIGPGARWSQVYEEVENEGLLVVGGRAGDVGVGGLVLGGGLSFLSNRYGWACDNVLSYEVVLPNTTAVLVDESHYPDLYWALRGAGSSNFGIVTSVEMEAIVPANPEGFWFSMPFFSWDKTPELLQNHHKLLTTGIKDDLDTAYINAFGYAKEQDMYLGITIQVHTSHKDNLTFPDGYKSYEHIDGFMPRSVDIWPYSKITRTIMDSNAKPGRRNYYGTFSHHPSCEFDQRLLQLWKDSTLKVKNVTGIQYTIVAQPIFENAMTMMKRRGGNSIGLSNTEGPLVIINQAWSWDSAEDDELCIGTARTLYEDAEKVARELGVYHPYKYINYAEEGQDVWAGYPQDNVKRLRQIQRKYDPEGIFTKGGLADGYFKLNEKSKTGSSSLVKDEL